MKKIIMILMLSLLGITQMVAQEYEYVPFVREGVKWVYEVRVNDYPWFISHTLELKGDVEINGKVYKAMHKYSGEEINWEDDTIPVYLREEDKVVYGIVPDGKTYSDCPIGIANYDPMNEKIAAGEEFVLYDFNEAESFMKSWIMRAIPSYITHPVIHDFTTIAGKKVNRYISFYYNTYAVSLCMIEGVGFDGLSVIYPLSVSEGVVGAARLSYVVENGEVIYRSERYKQPYEGPAEFLPIAREGVKWVNERVVIDHGDTTKYYYTYEFHGKTFRGSPICYQYTGDDLNSEDAFVAAIGTINRSPGFTDVVPFSEVVEAGRDMIHYNREINIDSFFYPFGWDYTDINNMVNDYIYSQRGDFLNRENFVEVEPLTIEGMTCRRYAYLDDNGEPLAYITEGIGFDSRDMGDLLTPFTRKPDPDADHQEYWGLSHVIKDGEIIYKGMRYHEEEGDVNGDGSVTIADVSALIDLLLESTPMFKQQCDVNGDGALTIGDVSTLIDKLLSMQ